MFPFKLTPKRSAYLQALELNDSNDVIRYFPRTYSVFELTPLDWQHNDQRVVIKGIIKAKERLVRFAKSRTIFRFKIIYDEDEYTVISFNRPYLPPMIVQGERALIVGKFNYLKKEIVLTEIITKDIDKLNIKPVYRLVDGVTNYEFQQVVKLCLGEEIASHSLDEIIPSFYRNKYRLIGRQMAYHDVHFPSDVAHLKQALRYLKYEELLFYSLALQKQKSSNKIGSISVSKKVDDSFVRQVIDKCGFKLTSDQNIAVKEIVDDLKNSGLMYRMLQGDVGSGKTLVATLGLVANYSAGYQGVMMAPTDILARQHYAFLTEFLKDYPIRIGLLVSALPSKEKREVISQIAQGKIDLIVGTHAIIQDGVDYKKLGLAVIDEQHRFGVKQRQCLKQKGDNVELLMMSATPIPRTLAITLYGDMDFSTLHAFPNQQRRVITDVMKGNTIKKLLPRIEEKVHANQRVFIVCPLIDEDEERRNVSTVYEGLDKYFKGRISVGLLHGRLDDAKKDEIMHQFQTGQIQVLVSTTVIEVGIDIKEASMMIIYDAQSFGLAALHQLRGRIGRGGQVAECYLLCNGGDDSAMKRLEYLRDHDDGFDIARFDLANRGPGDLMGTRQSGIPDLNISDLYDDLKILEVARDDAKEIMDHQDNDENKHIIAYVSRMNS